MYQGLFFNVVFNLLFVLSSYIMHYFLGTTMNPLQYGIVGTIITILDFEYLFLNNGVRQSLSKELAKEKYDSKDLIFKSLFFQVVLIIILFSVNFFLSPFFAKLFNDSSFTMYLRYVALIIPVNGIYVLFLGINDGLKHFVSSAWAGIFYSIAKLSVIPFIMFVFSDPVLGTIVGFLFAICVALIVAGFSVFRNRADLKSKYDKKIRAGNYMHNIFNFSLFFIIVSVVLSVDTLIVKSIIPDGVMAGYYTGAVNFGKVSYFLLSSFFTITLPVVTGLYSSGNLNKMSQVIKEMLILICSFILPITCIISASSPTLLMIFYKPQYIEASHALTILSFAHFFMGIAVMINMIISATNEKKFSTNLAIFMFIFDIFLCIVFTKYFGITGTATASLSCATITMILSGVFMKRKLFSLVNNLIVKLIFFNAILWLVSYIVFKLIPISNLPTLAIVYIGLYLLVITILLTTGLLKRELLYSILKK